MKLKMLCWFICRSFHEPVTRPKQPTLVAFSSLGTVNDREEHFLSFNKMIFKKFQTARARTLFLKLILVPLHIINIFCNILIRWLFKKEGVELYHRSLFFPRKTAEKHLHTSTNMCSELFDWVYFTANIYRDEREKDAELLFWTFNLQSKSQSRIEKADRNEKVVRNTLRKLA